MVPDERRRFEACVDAIASRVRTQFPKDCPSCGRRYANPADFLASTRAFGTPSQLDPSDDDPIGILELANCPCKSTIALRWEDGPGAERQRLHMVIATLSAAHGGSRVRALEALRAAIHTRLTQP